MARKKAAAKRSNNEGSVYQNKRGLWVAQATIGYDESGKQIRKAVSGKMRAEAVANLAPYLPKGGARKQIIKQDMALEKHMQFWLMKYKRRTVAPRTFGKYLINAKRYIYPFMGEYLPKDVSTNLLQDFLGGMLDDGYALDTVKHIKYQLGQYFDYCVDEKIVVKNPVDKVRLQARERKTAEQAKNRNTKRFSKNCEVSFLRRSIQAYCSSRFVLHPYWRECTSAKITKCNRTLFATVCYRARKMRFQAVRNRLEQPRERKPILSQQTSQEDEKIANRLSPFLANISAESKYIV